VFLAAMLVAGRGVSSSGCVIGVDAHDQIVIGHAKFQYDRPDKLDKSLLPEGRKYLGH